MAIQQEKEEQPQEESTGFFSFFKRKPSKISKLPERVEMKTLPQVCSKLGVICLYKDSLEISSKGEILGMHVTEEGKYQLVRQDLETGEILWYDYQHDKSSSSILLFEDNNLVLSGGNDYKLVFYNFRKGEVLKIMAIRIGVVFCLFKMQEIICVGGYKTVKFVDSKSLNEIITNKAIKTECEYVTCIDLRKNGLENKTGENTPMLYLTGFGNNNPNITTSLLPEEVYARYKIKNDFIFNYKDIQIEELTKENKLLKQKIKILENEKANNKEVKRVKIK